MAESTHGLPYFLPDAARGELQMRAIDSAVELKALWAIDCAAYGEASISYERFYD